MGALAVYPPEGHIVNGFFLYRSWRGATYQLPARQVPDPVAACKLLTELMHTDVTWKPAPPRR